MQVKIKSDIMTRNADKDEYFKTTDQIVDVKDEIVEDGVNFYIFEFKGKNLRIQKKLTEKL